IAPRRNVRKTRRASGYTYYRRKTAESGEKGIIEKLREEIESSKIEKTYLPFIQKTSKISDTYGDLRQTSTSRANPLATDIAYWRLESSLLYLIYRVEELKQLEKVMNTQTEGTGNGSKPVVAPTFTLDL